MKQVSDLSNIDTGLSSSFEQGTFTQFFFSIDDTTLTNIAYTNPGALKRMCMYLAVDQQLLLQELQEEKIVLHTRN